jgi:hypothetical protein
MWRWTAEPNDTKVQDRRSANHNIKHLYPLPVAANEIDYEHQRRPHASVSDQRDPRPNGERGIARPPGDLAAPVIVALVKKIDVETVTPDGGGREDDAAPCAAHLRRLPGDCRWTEVEVGGWRLPRPGGDWRPQSV